MTIAFDEWLNALEQAEAGRQRPKDSITIPEYMQRTGCSERVARRVLDGAVEAGKASKVACIFKGHLVNVFVPKEGGGCNASTRMKSGTQPRRKTNSTLG